MRDYDETTGRYLQPDPLGLVDGASVYGYALQSPGRYVDPRGEFGIVGALLGGGFNALSQFGTGLWRHGLTNYMTALRCIDISKVATSAAFGALGASPKGVISGAGGIGSVLGVFGIKWWTENVTTPVVRIGDECECKDGSDHRAGRDFILGLIDSFYL